MRIKFIKSYKYMIKPTESEGSYVTIKKGTKKEFRDGVAKNLIRQGFAQEID